MIRLFDKETDYELLTSWWKGHGWDAVPAAILPKLGVVSKEDGEPVAAAFLYMDNSVGVCWMEWFVANPAASGKAVIRAHRLICAFLKEEALRMDYGVMLTSCKQDSLVRLYERNGFQKTDSGVTHLIKILRTKGEE